ncbi:MAG: hypothetical protein K6F50_00200, partial [Kiritimatiellae bacterium]|nr:hypothetical protein [Kiritimatiellia bacterium]
MATAGIRRGARLALPWGVSRLADFGVSSSLTFPASPLPRPGLAIGCAILGRRDTGSVVSLASVGP